MEIFCENITEIYSEIFARPSECTWGIKAPLFFQNWKPKIRTTPMPFEIFFFYWHNALTTFKMRQNDKLYFLFNIMIIIEQIKSKLTATFSVVESQNRRGLKYFWLRIVVRMRKKKLYMGSLLCPYSQAPSAFNNQKIFKNNQ